MRDKSTSNLLKVKEVDNVKPKEAKMLRLTESIRERLVGQPVEAKRG